MKKSFSKISNFVLLAGALALANPYSVLAKSSSGSNQIKPAGSNVFVFEPRTLRWTVYGSNGKVIRSGKAVGGQRYCHDVRRACYTPVGSYRVYSKQGPGFRSSKFPLPHGGAPMPYAMFFRGGFAIHGSNQMPNRNASHGCIRVYPSDARWLSQNALSVGSKVVIKSY